MSWIQSQYQGDRDVCVAIEQETRRDKEHTVDLGQTSFALRYKKSSMSESYYKWI